jgi:hypothetical protein
MQQIALMKKHLLLFIAGISVAAGLHAQSLKLLNVNDPGIYCRFSPDCQVAPAEKSSSFTPTNLAATCVLESRSFAGKSMNTAGTYGYEYRITLNNAGESGAGFLTVDSLALSFDVPVTFPFGGHANNQVWVVATGGPGAVAPGSAVASGTNVVFQFNPPLVLATQNGQSTGTYFFGMVSTNGPRVTTAVITGSAQTSTNTLPVSFTGELPACTP